ncbi:hypothetical protein PsorP6_013398 [Peronosclerospora sorghi]|uniref:Uncharacterized protein n=1 Tax=Peronosclerospora sorghi TaxID=230839 RepID=A0ACC0WHI0_9STRA|nr:hypothetical protein PsorP6_013398 [Peronosclerospora sorghi]
MSDHIESSTQAVNLAEQARKSEDGNVIVSLPENQQLTKSSNSIDSPTNGDSDNEYVVRFSMAQLKAKIAQAKHEMELASDAKLMPLKKELIEWRYKFEDGERERDKIASQCQSLRVRLDAVLEEQKEVLQRREDKQLDKLEAALEVEKSTRRKVQEAYEKQLQVLSLAQERVEKLDRQVAEYQKTETVLAQSVAHLQHRFVDRDQHRAASVEQVERELNEQHDKEMTALRNELAIARSSEEMAQEKLQETQNELEALRSNTQQVLASNDDLVAKEHEQKAKIAQVETDKEVLMSKLEQVQKVDAQLRSRIHALSEEITTLQQEKERLQQDNKELGEIASDLMQMAERQHTECGSRNANLAQDKLVATSASTYEEDGMFLQKRKKRLRLSLG